MRAACAFYAPPLVSARLAAYYKHSLPPARCLPRPSLQEKPPVLPTADVRNRDCELCERVVPTDPNVPYDMSLVIKEVRR